MAESPGYNVVSVASHGGLEFLRTVGVDTILGLRTSLNGDVSIPVADVRVCVCSTGSLTWKGTM